MIPLRRLAWVATHPDGKLIASFPRDRAPGNPPLLVGFGNIPMSRAAILS